MLNSDNVKTAVMILLIVICIFLMAKVEGFRLHKEKTV